MSYTGLLFVGMLLVFRFVFLFFLQRRRYIDNLTVIASLRLHGGCAILQGEMRHCYEDSDKQKDTPRTFAQIAGSGYMQVVQHCKVGCFTARLDASS